MALSDTKLDVKKYEDSPDVVRYRFANREYPEEDEPFIREWLRAKERREKLSHFTDKVMECCIVIAFSALLIPVGQ
jgi:hypothetical protein